jgi:hypothetical protein
MEGIAMRTFRWLSLALFPLILGAGGEGMKAPMQTNPGFEKLKTLVGSWETKSPDGNRSTASYELVSAGSALLERIGGMEHKDMDMITVYHPDGARLVMTHYCSAGNQPRMGTEPVKGETRRLHFAFLDATSLAAPSDGHMHDLVVTFVDPDHFDQEWTWQAGGKDNKQVFHWARAK